MTDIDWDQLEEQGADTNVVKALRAQVKKLEKELGQFRTSKRDTEVEKVLAKLPEGKREKAKRLIGDSDPNEWFEDFGDLFGAAEAPAEAKAEEQAAPAAEPEVADAAALQAISAATSGGSTPDFATRFGQQVGQVSSEAELTNLIYQALKGQGQ